MLPSKRRPELLFRQLSKLGNSVWKTGAIRQLRKIRSLSYCLRRPASQPLQHQFFHPFFHHIMTVKSILLAAGTLAILATTSCKKDDNNGGGGSSTAPSASTLAAGTGYITFNTDKAFNGGTSHTYKEAAPYDQVKCIHNGNVANFAGMHSVVSGTSATVSTVSLYVSATSTGKLDFSKSDAVFSIAVATSAGTVQEAYAMDEGTLEVTKLSATEIEGTFSGKAVNETSNTSINISSGSFSGKF
jgi:hypothetical protein